jgi:hypothetical protein
MGGLGQIKYFQVLFALSWAFPIQVSCQAVNHQNLQMPQSLINEVFQSKGANCFTGISFESNHTFWPFLQLPSIQLLLDGNKGLNDDILSVSLEMCPFLAAALFTNETTSTLLQLLTEQKMPQNVFYALFLQDINFVSSNNEIFHTNLNAIVVSPVSNSKNDDFVLWQPRLHPYFSLEEVAVSIGTKIAVTSKHSDCSIQCPLSKLLIDPARLNLHGAHLRASAVAYPPFYMPGDENDAL